MSLMQSALLSVTSCRGWTYHLNANALWLWHDDACLDVFSLAFLFLSFIFDLVHLSAAWAPRQLDVFSSRPAGGRAGASLGAE